MRGLIITILTFTGLFAENITISGTYQDLLNNPIDSAKVYYTQDLVLVDSTLTNSSGYFNLAFTVVSVNPTLPSSFQLSQNYPNPFNPSTRIDLSIQGAGIFSIYDIRGARVESIQLPGAGSYQLTWGGRNQGAGLYIYVLRNGQQAISRKMILLDGGDGSGLSVSQLSYSSSSHLLKPASNDAIRFEKENTSSHEIHFFSPLTDTSFGVIHGNIGPSLLEMISDTLIQLGDSAIYNMNQKIDNDELLQLTTNDARLQIVQDTLLKYIATSADTIAASITAIDRTDPNFSLMMNFAIYTPAPLIPTMNLPDTLFGFEDSSGILIPNLNAYRTDGGIQAVIYSINNQTNPDLVNASVLNDTTLRYSTLLTNQSGQSIVTIAIDDGNYNSQDNAVLLVQPVNDPIRYIGDIGPQETVEDSTLTIDLRSEFENLDNDMLDYVVNRLGLPLENASQVDNNGIVTITPSANWNGTLDSLIAEARVRDTDETAQSGLFDVYVAPRPDSPTVVITPIVTSVNEDSQGEILIANFTANDADGDILTQTFYNSQPDSVFLRMAGSQILLDSLAKNFNGSAIYGVTAIDGQLEVSEQCSLIINPQADVTLRIRTLNYAGTPIMDNVMSTFQIGDSTYQAIGQITKQVTPGTYEIWAENDSTGAFDSLGTFLGDPYISIRTGNGNPLVTQALATRCFDDESSAVTFGTEDIILELYKISNLSLENWIRMNYIIDNDGPQGIVKPNTATPECYIDTSFANYSEPSAEMVVNAQYITEILMPMASEGRYTPIWMGFGTVPNSDPNGETVLMFEFDNSYSPPGNSLNLINDNNILYYAKVFSHPTANSLAGLAGEGSQGFTAMQGDLPGGNEVTYLIRFNDEGQIVPTEFAKFIHRVRDHFNPGDNI